MARGAPARGRGARLHDAARRRDRRRRPGRASRSARGCASSASRRSSSSGTRAPATRGASRYKSLCLHDPVWYDHLPYIKFPENWPVFSPKDKIGDWLEMYTRVMELNYWGSTTAKSARYDEDAGEWEVRRRARGRRDHAAPKAARDGDRHVRQAATCRRFPGIDVFKGDQHHSSQHPGPDAYGASACVVIGSNNSAHDICAALWEARSRRHDGPAFLHPHGQVGHADGHRLSARCTPRRRCRGRHDNREGGYDLRLAALPGHGTSSRSRSTTRSASATRTSTRASRRPGSSTTGARTTPGCS